MSRINVFWFRRDLRLDDNTGLNQALLADKEVLPIFIFDTEILDKLENKYDRRVDLIHQALQTIHQELTKHKSGIKTFFGKPIDIFRQIVEKHDVEAVFCNRDYEPDAIKRDRQIKEFLQQNGISLYDFKDQVIFEKDDIVKKDQNPYTVFTPYSRKWKEKFNEKDITSSKIDFGKFLKHPAEEIHSLESIGFKKTDFKWTQPILDKNIIDGYHKNRDFPALDETSHLGADLRFGTLSVRKCVKFALQHNETWLNELIWREFFMQILYHFPKVTHHCFKEKYENIQWRNDEKEFRSWCEGKTGYPIIDAGMRQLNETGFMHNRVRMITASFLTKHLLIDWRWGEAYFAEKLLDYELSSNNGNWQWAAGCGCDAAPYFRIFKPYEQTKKFDKDQQYIKKWISEDDREISPIVEHTYARQRALDTYKKAVKE